MEILPPPEVSTEHWTAKVEQYELPNYRDLPSDAFKARGKTWSQDPAGRPWFDRDGAAEKIDDLVSRGLISADEEKLLRQWVEDGYFVLRMLSSLRSSTSLTSMSKTSMTSGQPIGRWKDSRSAASTSTASSAGRFITKRC